MSDKSIETAQTEIISKLFSTKLQEVLAHQEHSRWSRWHKYLLSCSSVNPDGSVTIPSTFAERWKRQCETVYTELPEEEKRSDRKEAFETTKTIYGCLFEDLLECHIAAYCAPRDF